MLLIWTWKIHENVYEDVNWLCYIDMWYHMCYDEKYKYAICVSMPWMITVQRCLNLLIIFKRLLTDNLATDITEQWRCMDLRAISPELELDCNKQSVKWFLTTITRGPTGHSHRGWLTSLIYRWWFPGQWTSVLGYSQTNKKRSTGLMAEIYEMVWLIGLSATKYLSVWFKYAEQYYLIWYWY